MGIMADLLRMERARILFKPGKVTIPYHSGDIASIVVKSILMQAGIRRNL
jgi:hypothetical protein